MSPSSQFWSTVSCPEENLLAVDVEYAEIASISSAIPP
jgi:hypothetical protein